MENSLRDQARILSSLNTTLGGSVLIEINAQTIQDGISIELKAPSVEPEQFHTDTIDDKFIVGIFPLPGSNSDQDHAPLPIFISTFKADFPIVECLVKEKRRRGELSIFIPR